MAILIQIRSFFDCPANNGTEFMTNKKNYVNGNNKRNNRNFTRPGGNQ